MNELANRRNLAVPVGLTVMADIFISHAKNAEVWDVDGNRYIDFATGSSTMNVGHSHPKVVDALHAQVDKFTHTFFQQLPYEPYVDLCEKLNTLVPGNFKKRTALFTDGSGAVENAIKIAKSYTNRSGVIAFHGGFHGRTYMSSTVTGKVSPYKINLGTPAPEVYHVPFPSEIDNVSINDSIAGLSNLFKFVVDPNTIAAIIIEPVQGEGGFRVAPQALMQHLRTVCDTYGIVFIADEVQTGFGRTGKFFAMEHYNVTSDITVMSKSIGAGIPLAAVTGKEDIMNAQHVGGIGGTYNGNPLGCVAGNAVIDIINSENLLTKSIKLGTITRECLNLQKLKYSEIADVRGIGSMTAIEIHDSNGPSTELARKIQRRARENGLILIMAGVNMSSIRFLYPLTISEETLQEGLRILEKTLEEVL